MTAHQARGHGKSGRTQGRWSPGLVHVLLLPPWPERPHAARTPAPALHLGPGRRPPAPAPRPSPGTGPAAGRSPALRSLPLLPCPSRTAAACSTESTDGPAASPRALLPLSLARRVLPGQRGADADGGGPALPCPRSLRSPRPSRALLWHLCAHRGGGGHRSQATLGAVLPLWAVLPAVRAPRQGRRAAGAERRRDGPHCAAWCRSARRPAGGPTGRAASSLLRLLVFQFTSGREGPSRPVL